MKQRIRIHKAEPNTGVLNYSHLLDAPAGKHGFVEAKKGHLYFEDGTRARFLGFNVAARSNTPDHETADRMAERFSMGVNIIRLHAADAPVGEKPGSWSSSRKRLSGLCIRYQQEIQPGWVGTVRLLCGETREGHLSPYRPDCSEKVLKRETAWSIRAAHPPVSNGTVCTTSG